MKEKINQKGFIQIPLLVIVIVSMIIASVGVGIVLHKQGKLTAITANISETFKKAEKPAITDSEKEIELEIRLEVLEAGFQNVDEFRKEYERAKEICEASDKELRERLKARAVSWECLHEISYWLLTGDLKGLHSRRFEKVEIGDPPKNYYCLSEGSEYPSGGLITPVWGLEHIASKYCIVEDKYFNAQFFPQSKEMYEKYSEKIGNYYCDSYFLQRVNEAINEYRKSESASFGKSSFHKEGLGGCDFIGQYKELYQKVMK